MKKEHIGDDVLCNIISRLPGKSLLRLRCASKHWNNVISDPSFMKSRSRRMILLPYTRPLMVIDDNVPAENVADSMVEIRSPLIHEKGTHVTVVGTLNGIVLLALHDKPLRCHLILYNPLTCASKILVVMDPPSSGYPYVFGFDGLKIVRLEIVKDPSNHWKHTRYKCDAFDLKNNSWSIPPQYLKRDFDLAGDAGMFLDGFLYWSAYFSFPGILALNVKDMVFSKVTPPIGHHEYLGLLLGFLEGCLCMITNRFNTSIEFDVWLMKKEAAGVWLKAPSFSFGSEPGNAFYPLCVLGEGKILLEGCSSQLVIYDTSNNSYKALIKGLATLDDSIGIDWILGFKNLCFYIDYPRRPSRPIEYVETLVSPSNICHLV